jgi:hypothetical protein
VVSSTACVLHSDEVVDGELNGETPKNPSSAHEMYPLNPVVVGVVDVVGVVVCVVVVVGVVVGVVCLQPANVP